MNMKNDEEELLNTLLGLGMVAVAGYGIYRILKSFAGYTPGETVSVRHLLGTPSDGVISSGNSERSTDTIYEYCSRCGEVTERFDTEHCHERHCKRCHARDFCGEEGCYCGNCFHCYGHAGGNECNVCSSD